MAHPQHAIPIVLPDGEIRAVERAPVVERLSWAFYDFAYSAFSFLLVVRFLPTWIINDLNRPDWYVTVTQVVVVLFVLIAMPLAGAVADQTGRRKPLLIAFTLASCERR